MLTRCLIFYICYRHDGTPPHTLKLLETFMTMFGVLSCIIWKKKQNIRGVLEPITAFYVKQWQAVWNSECFCVILACRIVEKRHEVTINQIKLKICKEVLWKICTNFDGDEKFINNKIKKLCSRKKEVSLEEVIILFMNDCVSSFLLALKNKILLWNKRTYKV